ncbi:MAG TPA: hypothetical protein H9952_09675 [Candidatus Massiliomicrobiota merdigallinarum]|nr:hypothetical protein [Candidatus Massilimicrobiota merdigallinarum]
MNYVLMMIVCGMIVNGFRLTINKKMAKGMIMYALAIVLTVYSISWLG